MKRIKVGLNGFGRIGRAFTRIALERDNFDIVAINTRKTAPDMLAYLLQYDSVYRKYSKEVRAVENGIEVDGVPIFASVVSEPNRIPWEMHGVDVVVDASGAFTTKEELSAHLRGSVKKVLLSAPSKDDVTTHVVLGVNDNAIDWEKETVISNASCTTNCAAPMFKIVHDALSIVSGYVTTVHAYTATQSLLDEANKKPDRSRAAGLNISPSTTGATKAVAKVIPGLAGKLDGMSIRVPVPTVSFTDISATVAKPTTVDELHHFFKIAAETTMKGKLHFETEKLVSSDYIGSSYSCIFDANYTKVVNGTLVKVFGWYDNEWGYATRMVDLVDTVAKYI